MEDVQDNPFEGLTKDQLMDQMTRYVQAEQAAKKAAAKAIEDFESWSRRLNVAKTSNNEQLISEALKQKDLALAQVMAMKTELEKLEQEVNLAKQQIKTALIQTTSQVSGTDPNQLLASLESMTGKKPEELGLERQLKETEADSLLSSFKEQLKKEGKL
jgi:acyl-CoA reductase-like NAD-dependent aldehyde dehydrogenase